MRGLSAVLLTGLLFAAPAAAQHFAESSSRPNSRARSSSAPSIAGSLRSQVYDNAYFGFSYKPPFGWVDRTADMNQPDPDDKNPPSKSQVLLAMFERPPEAKGSTVNSAVVIAAESVSSFPGLKTASDYFGPLEDAATAKGFKVVNEPYEFSVGGRQLIRADFSKALGSLTMQQTSLVILEKGYVVSFTFIAASDDEMDDLISRLTFARPAARGK